MTRTSKFDTRFNDSFTCVNLPYKYISACSWHMGGVGRCCRVGIGARGREYGGCMSRPATALSNAGYVVIGSRGVKCDDFGENHAYEHCGRMVWLLVCAFVSKMVNGMNGKRISRRSEREKVVIDSPAPRTS